MISTDILVVGSGAAGLAYAIKVADKCTDKIITVITKSYANESNTKYAQGGVAVVLNKLTDNFDKHIADTMRAGDGRSNRVVVEMVVRDAPSRIHELVKWGVPFDLDEKGDYDLGREGGHSQNRVIHHKDNTGEAIEQILIKKASAYTNIRILDFHLAVELLLSKDGKTCQGADVLNIKQNTKERIDAQITVLATGGCGAVYESTTNPQTSTGDGIALAIRANATVSDMQYIQFHPTAVYEETKGKLALVTEALRGEGARLLNAKKQHFMSKYDDREELASRDIVSRAIHQEMKLHHSKFVYIDCRSIDKERLINHFPNIYQECEEKGYDLHIDLLPIAPASHYLCGGIDVNIDGESSITNLYAIGECSNTGLHGANRLASNSLLEALVYGCRAAEDTVLRLQEVVKKADKEGVKITSMLEVNETKPEDIENIKRELRSLMSHSAGIVRNTLDLQLAKEKCEELERTFNTVYSSGNSNVESEEIRNMLCIGKTILEQSLAMKSNAGTFYNIDLDEKR